MNKKNYKETTDEELIYSSCSDIWPLLQGKRIFITGGTGFFGKNLLDALIFVNRNLSRPINIHVLSRDPQKFLSHYSIYHENQNIFFHQGDIRDFSFPKEKFDFVIHAATETNKTKIAQAPIELLDNIISGTRHCLEFAHNCGAEKFLLISSGAVYGNYSPIFTKVPETYTGTTEKTDIKSVYAQGKRIAELWTRLLAEKYHFSAVIARGFAFTGKYLPLDQHFAIGNFILNGMDHADILIRGDGTPMRSYLYSSDLVTWLLKLLLLGKDGEAYNLGSDEEVSIFELAEMVAADFSEHLKITTLEEKNISVPKEWYVPSIEKAKMLGLEVSVPLSEAVYRTIEWNKKSIK